MNTAPRPTNGGRYHVGRAPARRLDSNRSSVCRASHNCTAKARQMTGASTFEKRHTRVPSTPTTDDIGKVRRRRTKDGSPGPTIGFESIVRLPRFPQLHGKSPPNDRREHVWKTTYPRPVYPTTDDIGKARRRRAIDGSPGRKPGVRRPQTPSPPGQQSPTSHSTRIRAGD